MAIKKNTSRVTGTDSVRYLRVSGRDQVDTDYNPEGISLPAQRKALVARERELNSINVAEFIDPGKSGKSIEHREAFQDMMAYLKANRNVKYVMVYALSRWARSRYEDYFMMVALEQLGVSLISATERNIDDTATGRLTHGMVTVINQYTVDLMSEDIKYKMGQKVIEHGGTITKAPIGYKNIEVEFEGRLINTVIVDADRRDHVWGGFELFATGEYTIDTL